MTLKKQSKSPLKKSYKVAISRDYNNNLTKVLISRKKKKRRRRRQRQQPQNDAFDAKKVDVVVEYAGGKEKSDIYQWECHREIKFVIRRTSLLKMKRLNKGRDK